MNGQTLSTTYLVFGPAILIVNLSFSLASNANDLEHRFSIQNPLQLRDLGVFQNARFR